MKSKLRFIIILSLLILSIILNLFQYIKDSKNSSTFRDPLNQYCFSGLEIKANVKKINSEYDSITIQPIIIASYSSDIKKPYIKLFNYKEEINDFVLVDSLIYKYSEITFFNNLDENKGVFGTIYIPTNQGDYESFCFYNTYDAHNQLHDSVFINYLNFISQ